MWLAKQGQRTDLHVAEVERAVANDAHDLVHRLHKRDLVNAALIRRPREHELPGSAAITHGHRLKQVNKVDPVLLVQLRDKPCIQHHQLRRATVAVAPAASRERRAGGSTQLHLHIARVQVRVHKVVHEHHLEEGAQANAGQTGGGWVGEGGIL